ncbi:MAG TPA: NAD(P)H-binding protein [Galbitalea sp.]
MAGGTGTVGRHVVESLRAAGHEPIVLTRSTGVDLMSGDGLAAVLRGADAVVDVTSVGTSAGSVSERFFRTVTTNLLAAEEVAGVPHHLALSIVGAAQIGAAYYAGKRIQEELVMAAEGRWTIARATQFHEFIFQIMPPGTVGPLQLVPTIVAQPIAAAEAGAIIARIAVAGPAGLTPDIAGPKAERFADLIRRYLRATGSRRPVLQVPFPGVWGRSLRDGSLLPTGTAILGTQTFDEWLHAVTSAASSTR